MAIAKNAGKSATTTISNGCLAKAADMTLLNGDT